VNMQKRKESAVPYINVTPLIDVLLVLLIIFMVVSPLKPASFKASIPKPPQPDDPVNPDILNLVITIKRDGALELNQMGDIGTVNDTGKLSSKLAEIFQLRREHKTYRWDMKTRDDLPVNARIQKTVFVKAPKSISYGDVAKVIDGIKGAGAAPIGLQVDKLDW
jgi:biopolymer transport protein TolR